ncbi:MAG: hypothetical protein ABEJ71_03280 [Halodesulfurarchaeum sp.]
MTYTWASQSVVRSFNAFFLGYIALFALSGFALSSAVVTFDAAGVARPLEGRVSTRLYGGVLGVMAVALSALWLSEIVPATLAGMVPPTVTEFDAATKNTSVLDLGIVVPSLAIAAWWLSRERDWGNVFAGVLVTMADVLAPAITGMTIWLLTGGVAISGPLLVGSIVPPLVGVAVATRFILAIPRGRGLQVG